MTIYLTAHVHAKPDQANKVKELLLEMLDPTHAEDGCLFYELISSTDEPNEFVFMEKWETMAHLEAHKKTEHFRRIFGIVTPMLEKPLEIKFYEAVCP